MAFTEQEKQLIIWGKEHGKSAQDIQLAVAKLRAGVTPPPAAKPAPTPDTVVSRIGADIQNAGDTVEQAISGSGDFATHSDVRRGVEATAAAFNAVPAVATDLLPKFARTGLNMAGKALGGVLSFVADKIGNIPALQSWVTQHPQAAKALEEVAGTAAPAGQIAGDILAADGAAKGAQKTVDLTKRGVNAASQKASDLIAQARPATAKLIQQSKELIKPAPTPIEAVGEVLQGKTKDIKPGMQALSAIDTNGVNTYAQLQQRIDSSIGKLSSQVDEHLAQDPTPIPLSQLATKTVSSGGREVVRNYVQTAIDNLKELYQTTADDTALANVEDLAAKAQTDGLTRLEVNDLSRLYNVEFGSKAFSKATGEPLTSVNAQMYENIRSGLKDVARQGMGGTEAAATDKVISALYNTKALVNKSVEAVNKLQQRVADRGLLESVGHAVAKYGDILTGGSIRGLIGGLLPRGAGYKVMNALDLEERLRSNLDIINQAIKSGSNAEIIKLIGQLPK